MNLKQRVFADIAIQVPFGSNKMTHQANRIASAYVDELKQNRDRVAEAARLCEEEFGHEFDVNNVNHLAIINMSLVNEAYDEVAKVREELVTEGYLRTWTTRARFGMATYYGLTAKGWKYAKRYIDMMNKSA